MSRRLYPSIAEEPRNNRPNIKGHDKRGTVQGREVVSLDIKTYSIYTRQAGIALFPFFRTQ